MTFERKKKKLLKQLENNNRKCQKLDIAKDGNKIIVKKV